MKHLLMAFPLLVALAREAAAQPTWRSSTTTWSATTSSLVVSTPAGVIAGDVLVFCVAHSVYTITYPSGWSQIIATNTAGGSVYQKIAVKVATASEPSSYTFTIPFSAGWNVIMFAIAGAKTSPVPEAYLGSVDDTFNTTMTAASITTTTPSSLLVAVFTGNAAGTWTPPGGMTEKVDFNATRAHCVDTEVRAAAGATGSRAATSSVSMWASGSMLSFAPASAPAPSVYRPATSSTRGASSGRNKYQTRAAIGTTRKQWNT